MSHLFKKGDRVTITKETDPFHQCSHYGYTGVVIRERYSDACSYPYIKWEGDAGKMDKTYVNPKYLKHISCQLLFEFMYDNNEL